MADSQIIEIADAIVADLNENAEAWSLEFTAVRAYAPVYDLADMGTMHVTVAPSATVESLADRSTTEEDCGIDVAIQVKPAATDNATLDGLMELVAEVKSFLRKRSPTGTYAEWDETKNEPIYDVAALRTKGLFVSLLRLRYIVHYES